MSRARGVRLSLTLLALAVLLGGAVSAHAAAFTERATAYRAAPADETPAAPTPRRLITPDAPLNVLVAGDSFAQPLATELNRYARRDGLMTTRLDFRISSGLALPSFFNWPARLTMQMTGDATPEAVVFFVGANDMLNMWNGSAWVARGTPEWKDEYARRAATIMDIVGDKGASLYWVGMPIMRDDWRTAAILAQNRAAQEEAALRPWVHYVDVWPLFTDDNGGYAATLPNATGQWVQVRQADGVHLTWAGTAWVAERVYAAMQGEWSTASVADATVSAQPTPAPTAMPAPPPQKSKKDRK